MTSDLYLSSGHLRSLLSAHDGLGLRNDPILNDSSFGTAARFQRLEELGSEARKVLPSHETAEFWAKGLWTLANSIRKEKAVRFNFHEADSIESRVVQRACAEVAKNIPNLTMFSLSLVAEALGILGYRDISLFKLLGEEVRAHRTSLTPPQIKRFLWSQSHLNIEEPRITAALVKAALSADRHSLLSESERSRVSLALAHLSPQSVRFFLRPDFLDDRDCSLQSWTEKYHALLIANEVSPSDRFERRSELAALERSPERNNFEAGAEIALRRFLDERKIDYGLHSQHNIAGVFPDLVLYLADPDRIIAIELDGYQFHFTWGPDGGTRFGRDLVRRKVLEAHGVEMVHITSHEWNTTPSSSLFSEALGL